MPIMMSRVDDDADDEATPVVCFQKTHAARSTEYARCLLYRGLLLCDKFHRNPQTVFPLNRATVASHAYYFSACMYGCECVWLCVDYCIWLYSRNENRFSTPRVNERLETMPRTLHFRVSSMWGGRSRYRFGGISRYLNSGVIYCPLFRYREPFESDRIRRKITDLVQTNLLYWNFTWPAATVLMASCEVMMLTYHRLCVQILN